MANADKCHLNIPFKDYLKSLRVDSEGKVDEASLATAASQEFENYKAIERRVNDSACGGTGTCGCSYVIAETGNITLTLTASKFTYHDILWTNANIIFESGGWTASANKLVPPNPTALHNVSLNSYFGPSSVDVMTENLITDFTDSYVSAWRPANYGGEICQSRIANMNPALGFGVSNILRSVTNITTSASTNTFLYAHEICSCAAPLVT